MVAFEICFGYALIIVIHFPNAACSISHFQEIEERKSRNLAGFQMPRLGARRGKYLHLDAGNRLPASQRQIVRHLHLHPEIRRGSKIPRQTQRRIRRNPAALAHNLRDARNRHSQGKGQSIGRKPQRLQENPHAKTRRGESARPGPRVFAECSWPVLLSDNQQFPHPRRRCRPSESIPETDH